MIVRIDKSTVSQFGFNEWQRALLSELISNTRNTQCGLHNARIINMGAKSGHTFFAQSAAKITFPIRTKVFASSQKNIGEFAKLLFRPQECHETIDILSESSFPGYYGSPVGLIIVDLDRSPLERFLQSLKSLVKSMNNTPLLILDPNL